MSQYSVKYEIEARPTSVIVELICKDKEDMIKTYEERISNPNCKKVEKFC